MVDSLKTLSTVDLYQLFYCTYTVETPNKGNLSIMNRITCPKTSLAYDSANTFITSEERKPLYNEQNNLSQMLRYSEILLHGF